jgi:hypothetical protein
MPLIKPVQLLPGDTIGIILPIGCRAHIDSHNQRFEIIEAAVSKQDLQMYVSLCLRRVL